MRRLVLVTVGAAAAVTAIALWIGRSIPTVPGNMPGGATASAINTWMNGPSYKIMAAMLDPGPEDQVLDVACGDGAFLARYVQAARYVAGLDRYDVKVELARRRLADRIAAGTAEVVEGDAEELPWEDDRFTAVTCMDAFSFFPHPDAFLYEVHRVLRTGGRAVMMIGAEMPEGSEPRTVLGHVQRNEDDVRRMVEAADFEMSMAYRPMGGDNRLANAICRRLFGTDQVRIVTAAKPAAVRAEVEVAPVEALAVGRGS